MTKFLVGLEKFLHSLTHSFCRHIVKTFTFLYLFLKQQKVLHLFCRHTTQPHGSGETWGCYPYISGALCSLSLAAFCSYRMRECRCPELPRPARDRGDLIPSQRLCRLQSVSSRLYDGVNARSGCMADHFS